MPTPEQWHQLADAIDLYDETENHPDPSKRTPIDLAARALCVVRFARAVLVAHATETPSERANRRFVEQREGVARDVHRVASQLVQLADELDKVGDALNAELVIFLRSAARTLHLIVASQGECECVHPPIEELTDLWCTVCSGYKVAGKVIEPPILVLSRNK